MSDVSLIYTILVHGIVGDHYTIDEIEEATGCSGLRTPKNSYKMFQAINKCLRRNVRWVRQHGIGVTCVESPNKSRTRCKADPIAARMLS